MSWIRVTIVERSAKDMKAYKFGSLFLNSVGKEQKFIPKIKVETYYVVLEFKKILSSFEQK